MPIGLAMIPAEPLWLSMSIMGILFVLVVAVAILIDMRGDPKQ